MLIDERRKELAARIGPEAAKRIAADITIHKRPVGFVARRTFDNEHI